MTNETFLSKDVANWIEHSNPRMTLKSIDEEEKVVNNVYTLGGIQKTMLLFFMKSYHNPDQSFDTFEG